MKNSKTNRLVLSAIFCVLVFIFTYILIPAPIIGNINLGDSIIIISALILGGYWAVFSSAIGASICDLVSGYAIYTPATFIIKGIMVAIIINFLKIKTKKQKTLLIRISFILAESFMVLGYFVYEALFLGYGWGAIYNAPFNIIQGVVNIVLAVLFYGVFKKVVKAK